MSWKRIGLVVLVVFLMVGSVGADPCGVWQRLAPFPAPVGLNGIAGGVSQIVAVGDSGTVLVSDDVVGWARAESPTSLTLQDVAWSSERVVAVGLQGTIITSDDGVAGWHTVHGGRDTVAPAALHGVIHGEPGWVAVGADSTILYSDDGRDWTSVGSEVSDEQDLVAVVWRGQEFVAVGSGGLVVASTDGLSWSEQQIEMPGLRPAGLATDGIRMLVVGDHGSAFSADGREWVAVDGLAEVEARVATWTGEAFVVLATPDATLTSADGETWSWSSTAPWVQAQPRSVTAWSGAVVGVGDGGSIAYRRFAPGHQWVVATGTTTVALEAVASMNGTTVMAGGAGGLDAVSVLTAGDDGVRFSRVLSAGPGVRTVDVTSTGSSFVAVGNGTDLGAGAQVLVSADGRSWSAGELVDGTGFPPAELESVAAGLGRVVAVGDGRAIVSVDDGASWLWSTLADESTATRAVASDGVRFVVVGDGNAYSSSDGLSWEAHPGSFGPGSRAAAAWGNGRYVAVGSAPSGGAAWSSPDGVTWSQATGVVSEPLTDVVYAGDQFVAVGESGSVAFSANGEVWSSTRLPDRVSLRGVGWDGEWLFVVGGWGYIARSTCAGAGDPAVDFTWFPDPVLAGQPVRFWSLDDSDAESVSWAFGDGGSSDHADPVHVFAEPGEYEVVLTDTVSGAVAEHMVTVLPGPPVRGESVYLMGVAHVDGLNQSRWRTDVELCHLEDAAVEVQLRLLERDRSLATPMTVAMELPAASCSRLNDIVTSVFATEGAGVLEILADRRVLATARTYTENDGGTYGFSVAAVDPRDAPCCMERWMLPHLSQSARADSGSRTNISLFNPGSDPEGVELQLLRANGEVLSTRTVQLDGREYRQLVQPLLEAAPGGVADAFALVRATSPVLVSASVIDNRTGDPVAVEPQPTTRR